MAIDSHASLLKHAQQLAALRLFLSCVGTHTVNLYVLIHREAVSNTKVAYNSTKEIEGFCIS